MGYVLGSKSLLSPASLLALLLAMVMEIWDRDCGPFWANFAVFASLCQVGNTLSPCGKGPGQEELAIPVAYDQASKALSFAFALLTEPEICSIR